MRPTGDAHGGWDFFISYTQADRAWAVWIAWVLEEAGFRVLIQAWDFVPGSNWIQSMQAGARDASRTIAVLSEAYLASTSASAEWQAAWAGRLSWRGAQAPAYPSEPMRSAWPAGRGSCDRPFRAY